MKKRNWTAIKTILVTYLAISKILYWIFLIPADFDGVGGIVSVLWERLIERDLVIIVIVAITYFFEKNVKNQKGILAHVKLVVGNYLIYMVTLIIYLMILESMLPTPANLWMIIRSPFISTSTIIFIILTGAIETKERFKKKEAQEYALDIRCTEIKREMLKTLLDDGVLNQEECDKQMAKLLED